MDQINVNAAPPPPAGPPPRPSLWLPIAACLAIVAVVAIAFGIRHATAPGSASPPATPTPLLIADTPTGQPSATDTPASQAAAGATPTGQGGATETPAAQAAATATPAPPENPTALHVISGSCSNRAIAWSWPGGARATSYELVLYDPRTGATIKDLTTGATSYRLAAGPGATVALKLRSRNATGTGRGYFTPGSVGRVPPLTTDPTQITVKVTGHRITWSWAGSRHATAYDVVLFHYVGGTAHTDISGRTDQGRWSTAVTPGVTYYLKVRSVGACGPADYVAVPHGATAGATPTSGG